MPWYETPFARQLGLRLPIIQAPMAGGMSTPRLVAAAANAGALGCLAGAMLQPDELRAAIAEVRALIAEARALTGREPDGSSNVPARGRNASSGPARSFAVNLFSPLPAPSTDRVAEWAALTGVAEPAFKVPPVFDDQLAVVVEEGVPVFTFTFGIPALDGVPAIRIGTATTVAEAVELERAGVDAVVAQGYEAGGHRGTFREPVDRSLVGTLALVPQVVDAVSVPVIASGGIMDGRGIAAALTLGAQAVQLGTAFLRCAEAGTSAAHREALAGETTVTRVLTGRYARAVRTPLVDLLEASGLRPPDYPLPRYLAPEAPMLAGQGGPLARSMPAGELIARLADETGEALARVTGLAIR